MPPTAVSFRVYLPFWDKSSLASKLESFFMDSTAASASPFQQIPFRYGWVAAVVILLSLIILTGMYILIREALVVPTAVDTGTAELPTDVMQRARQLEALNRSLAEE